MVSLFENLEVDEFLKRHEEQLKNIESLALEEQVTDLLISQSKSEEENLSFEEVMTMG